MYKKNILPLLYSSNWCSVYEKEPNTYIVSFEFNRFYSWRKFERENRLKKHEITYNTLEGNYFITLKIGNVDNAKKRNL